MPSRPRVRVTSTSFSVSKPTDKDVVDFNNSRHEADVERREAAAQPNAIHRVIARQAALAKKARR